MNAPEPSSPPISEQVLGRCPWPSAEDALRPVVAGRRIVVTGAAGSIGRALATTVARFDPKRLDLIDVRPLETARADRDARSFRIDLRRSDDIDTFPWAEADILFHAAALKHLAPLERDPFAAIETNVLATADLLARLGHGASRPHFVLVSSDKAAAPSSVLGVSKLLAERIVAQAGGTSVRLANVLDSDGSLAPRVRRAVRLGRPVTVRDPEATRLVMTLEETVAALVEAASMEPSGDTLIPRELRPVRVTDMIAWAAGGARFRTRRTRLKPGEKRHEVLIGDHEEAQDLSPRLARILPQQGEPAVDLDGLRRAVDRREGVSLRDLLRAMLPAWRPSRSCEAALLSETSR